MNSLEVDLWAVERNNDIQSWTTGDANERRTIYRTQQLDLYRVVERVEGKWARTVQQWVWRRQPLINVDARGPLHPWCIITYDDGAVYENYLVFDSVGDLFSLVSGSANHKTFSEYACLRHGLPAYTTCTLSAFLRHIKFARVVCDFDARPARTVRYTKYDVFYTIEYMTHDEPYHRSFHQDYYSMEPAFQRFDGTGKRQAWMWFNRGRPYAAELEGQPAFMPAMLRLMYQALPYKMRHKQAFLTPLNHLTQLYMAGRQPPVPLVPIAPDETADCCVCLGAEDRATFSVRMPCGHAGHGVCLSHWLVRQRTCPLCRTAFQ